MDWPFRIMSSPHPPSTRLSLEHFANGVIKCVSPTRTTDSASRVLPGLHFKSVGKLLHLQNLPKAFRGCFCLRTPTKCRQISQRYRSLPSGAVCLRRSSALTVAPHSNYTVALLPLAAALRTVMMMIAYSDMRFNPIRRHSEGSGDGTNFESFGQCLLCPFVGPRMLILYG